MYVLIILLFIFILIPTLILSVVSWVLSLFGLRSKRKWHSTGRGFYYSTHSSDDAHTAELKSDKKGKKKIFAKDEGEYVDFEEIK